MPPLFVPKNVKKHWFHFEKADEIPQEIFNSIRSGFELQQKKTGKPVLSIAIIAWNEERNILSCLSSLSAQNFEEKIEIIVVNNNSTDNTQKIIEKCGVNFVFETKQGYAWARQAGMDAACGDFLLTGDADTIYPENWAKLMLKKIRNPKYSGIYSVCSFLPEGKNSRFGFFFFEILKEFSIRLRSINRPELSAMGASFVFDRKRGVEIGFPKDNKRGEDGRMALALKKYGKIGIQTASGARVWTITRTIVKDGTLIQALWKRIKREFARTGEYLKPQKGAYKERD